MGTVDRAQEQPSVHAPRARGVASRARRALRALRARGRLISRRLEGSFARNLTTPTEPISLDMGGTSETLLIAFGGMRGELGMPPFEFFKATGGIPVKRLFVRDLRQAWYHRGIPGHGETIEEAAASLLALIRRHRVSRLVVTGNSAGAYAALVFGTLMGADIVLCFAPQTVLDPDQLASMDDHRWDEQLRSLLDADGLDRRWSDLREALPAAAPLPGATRRPISYELYFDGAYTADRLHAEHLAGVEGVHMHRLDGGEHSIALEMRESGQLDRVLQDALTPRAGGL